MLGLEQCGLKNTGQADENATKGFKTVPVEVPNAGNIFDSGTKRLVARLITICSDYETG